MTLNDNEQGHVRAIVKRLERLAEERDAIGQDIKDVFLEAKGNGHDIKALKHVIKQRKKAPHVRIEEAALFATYEHAVGLAGDMESTPEA